MPRTATSSRTAKGDKLSKGAQRCLTKATEAAEEYMDELRRCADTEDLDTIATRHSLTLARVTRAQGAGRLEVTLQDGTTGVSVPISASIKMKGRASTKTDRINCMCVNDVIVLRGAFAAGKLSGTAVRQAGEMFARLGRHVPGGFFAPPGVDAAAAAAATTVETDIVFVSASVLAASASSGSAAADDEIDISAI
jgi:hypothetical protein